MMIPTLHLVITMIIRGRRLSQRTTHNLKNNGLDHHVLIKKRLERLSDSKTSRLAGEERISLSVLGSARKMVFFSRRLLLLALAAVLFSYSSGTAAAYRRNDFPPGLVFGAGTSAYQVEGAAAEDGRTPSIWDECAHAGKLPYKGTGDVACDQYYKYKEDVQLMKKLGLDAYRFSISWSRLIPNGRGPVNPMGLQYYNNLIDELISNGIQPHVTLFHDDMPQVLEDEYQGWLSPKIVKDFKAYANVCFQEFGDRVLHWTTINEANVLALGGYDSGIFPPLRCSYPFGIKCTQGDSTLEPYIAAHHMLLAHAAAAATYKKKYQAKQHGLIGLNVFIYWFSPSSNSMEDVNAAQRAQDFYTGWFLNPLVFGDYPEIMKKNAGSKIPAFTHLQSKQIMGSFDFFGLNHYTTMSVSDSPNILNVKDRDFNADMFAKLSFKQGGNRPKTIVRDCLCKEVYSVQRSFLTKMWIQFPAVPSGLRKVLEYVKQVYGNPPIYIHENGFPGPSNETLEDSTRVEYLDGYIRNMLDAVRNGSNARGYFVWSFMDCFELLGGYEQRFGLYHVDFDDKDLKRYPKLSARWYSGFLRGEDVMGIEKIPDDPLQKSQFVG